MLCRELMHPADVDLLPNRMEGNMDQQQGWTVEAIQRLTEMARERIPVATMSLALKRPIEPCGRS